MSFHDLDLHLQAGAVRHPAQAPRGLAKAERDVIAMARTDGRWSANPDGVLQRTFGLLFGIRVARPLANERLEGLRRFAIAAWCRDSIRARDLRALFEVGYSSNDAWRILAHIGEHRGAMPEVEAWPA